MCVSDFELNLGEFRLRNSQERTKPNLRFRLMNMVRSAFDHAFVPHFGSFIAEEVYYSCGYV